MEKHIKSHSETEIVNGCIALMQELVGEFEDYLDFRRAKKNVLQLIFPTSILFSG